MQFLLHSPPPVFYLTNVIIFCHLSRQHQLLQLSEETVRNELMNVQFSLQQEIQKNTTLR